MTNLASRGGHPFSGLAAEIVTATRRKQRTTTHRSTSELYSIPPASLRCSYRLRIRAGFLCFVFCFGVFFFGIIFGIGIGCVVINWLLTQRNATSGVLCTASALGYYIIPLPSKLQNFLSHIIKSASYNPTRSIHHGELSIPYPIPRHWPRFIPNQR